MSENRDIERWIIRCLNDWEFFDAVFDARSSLRNGEKSTVYNQMTDEIYAVVGDDVKLPATYSSYYTLRKLRTERQTPNVIPVKVLRAHTLDGFIELYYKFRGKGATVLMAYEQTVEYVRRYIPEFVPPSSSAASLQETINASRRNRRR